ncbi:MAG: IPT/TIG domain-containing protein [Verrucomicrobiota bacterium]|nr:IPT/TIG domain-containing protein [Verrucomicrobiota bacterium]
MLTTLRAWGGLPNIQRFEPAAGEPGMSVRIIGTGFQNVTSVMFGIAEAVFELHSDTLVEAIIPNPATSGPITVSTDRGFGASDTFFQVAPRIDTFVPTYGKPGDRIILHGHNFSGTSDVLVGGVTAVFEIVAQTQMTLVVPQGLANGVIELISSAGRTASREVFQTIGPGPLILDMEPSMASVGDLVSIRGVQFDEASTVLFTGAIPASFSQVADTQILARVPENAISGPITITTPLGMGQSLVDFLVIGAGPFISDLQPREVESGQQVVVTGVNLSRVTALSVGGVIASFEVVADGQLMFVLPPEANSGTLRFAYDGGIYILEDAIDLIGPGPVIKSFTPTRGVAGTIVQLQGDHFSLLTTVLFGTQEAEYEIIAESQMIVTIPEGVESSHFTLRSPHGEIISDTVFSVQAPAPILVSFEPSFGGVGSQVQIHGEYLNHVEKVFFGSTEGTFEVVADSQMHLTVPEGARTSRIRLQSGVDTFVADTLFYLPVTLDAMVPDKAVPGSLIIIHGTNLEDTQYVRFGGEEADLVVVGQDYLEVEVPGDALSGNVVVTTPAGSLAVPGTFGMLPTVETVIPLAGPVGSVIRVNGRGLHETHTVQIGSVTVPFEILGPASLAISIPFQATGGNITVINPQGRSVSEAFFQVRHAAELGLEVVLEDEPSIWQQPVQFMIKVRNDGPSPSFNLSIRHEMPEGVALRGSSNPRGGTEIFGNVVLDVIPALYADETVDIIHSLTNPHYGFEMHRFSVQANAFDPTMEDRQQDFLHVIEGPPVRLEWLSLDARKYRLRWDSALRGYLPKTRSPGQGNEGWRMVRETITRGVTWQGMDLNLGDAWGFFRLESEEHLLFP